MRKDLLISHGSHRVQPCPPRPDLWVTATLDDRKLSSRGLFDDTSHRQTQLPLPVHTGRTVCHQLPFHVYVRTSESHHIVVTVVQLKALDARRFSAAGHS